MKLNRFYRREMEVGRFAAKAFDKVSNWAVATALIAAFTCEIFLFC